MDIFDFLAMMLIAVAVFSVSSSIDKLAKVLKDNAHRG